MCVTLLSAPSRTADETTVLLLRLREKRREDTVPLHNLAAMTTTGHAHMINPAPKRGELTPPTRVKAYGSTCVMVTRVSFLVFQFPS